jgi:2-dehydropantoate 2-reductase
MSRSFQTVAIVGSGAVGLYYGGRLAAAGEDVKFLVRSDYQALAEHGLRARSIDGDFWLPQVNQFRTAEEIGPVDLVIVAWKTTANSQLRQVLGPLLHPETQVLTLQNGLGNCELLAEIVGPERVLGGMCFVCINRLEPGSIEHSGGGRISIGEWQACNFSRVEEITNQFQAAKISAFGVSQLQKSQWEKLVWNIPFNGLSVAAGGVTTDLLLAQPSGELRIRAIMTEVIAAAQALGLDLKSDLIDVSIERTRPMGAYRTSSMIDFLAGREVEMMPIWHEPLRQAIGAGVAMPQTQKLIEEIEQQLFLRE